MCEVNQLYVCQTNHIINKLCSHLGLCPTVVVYHGRQEVLHFSQILNRRWPLENLLEYLIDHIIA